MRRRRSPCARSSERGDGFETALKWATTFIEDSDSALVYATEGGYDADDYVVADREARDAVPAATWQLVINAAVNPDETYGVGLAAYSRGEVAISIQAWQRAADEVDSPTAAAALVAKGVALSEQGGRSWRSPPWSRWWGRFGQAQEPALQELVAKALVAKGVTFGEQGRPELAIAAFEEVEERFGQAQEPALQELVAWALFNKGVALSEQRQLGQAIAAFEEVERL